MTNWQKPNSVVEYPIVTLVIETSYQLANKVLPGIEVLLRVDRPCCGLSRKPSVAVAVRFDTLLLAQSVAPCFSALPRYLLSLGYLKSVAGRCLPVLLKYWPHAPQDILPSGS